MSGFIGVGTTVTGVSSINNRSGSVSLDAYDVGAIPVAEKGINGGVCDLDLAALVPTSRLPTLPEEFLGTWDAYNNVPTIISSTGSNGQYYRIGTSGATLVDGESSWSFGDVIIFNGTSGVWEKIGRQDAVTSVAGKIGAVTLVSSDVGINDSDDISEGSINIFISSDEADAVGGTSGTPSNSNRFVTDSDSRMTNGRTPSGSAGGELLGTYPNPSLAAHASKHLPSGLDPLTTATPVATGISNTEGTANSFARSDHIHALSTHAGVHLPSGSDPLTTAAPVSIGSLNSEGSANSLARSDHVHALSTHAGVHLPSGSDPLTTATPVATGTSNFVGSANSFARSDHVHSLSTHASSHLPSGSDPLTTAVPVSIGATNALGTANSFARSDHVHSPRYAPSATNPVSPTPISGDMYYNTVLNIMMQYDGSRSKWLSIESAIIDFGRSGNTAADTFYRTVDALNMSTTLGFVAFFNGTITSIGYTRSATTAATFEVTSNGITIASLASSAIRGFSNSLNADFSQDVVLSVRNATGSNTTNNVIGWVKVKWRI